MKKIINIIIIMLFVFSILPVQADDSIPVSFQQKTTPLKYQFAGDCYAFATIAGIETSIVHQQGQYVDLSEEQFINEYAKLTDSDGQGGVASIFNPLANNTVFINESLNPYDKNPNTNKLVSVDDGVKVEVISVAPTKEDIKKAILKYGAVTSGISTSNYENGVYHDGRTDYYFASNGTQDHAICIIGWNDELTIQGYTGFFIIKNSWGAIDFVSYEHNSVYYNGLSCYKVLGDD